MARLCSPRGVRPPPSTSDHSALPTGKLFLLKAGNTTLDVALAAWWAAESDAPPGAHTHMGCLQRWSTAADGRAAHPARCRPSEQRCGRLFDWGDDRPEKRRVASEVEHAMRQAVPSA